MIGNKLEHLALLTGFDGERPPYHNCLYVKLAKAKEYTFCLKDDQFLKIYKLLIDFAKSNNKLKDTIKQHLKLYRFLFDHSRPFEIVWRGKTDPKGINFEKENALNFPKRKGLTNIKAFRSERNPYTKYVIGEKIMFQYTPMIMGVFKGKKVTLDATTDVIIKFSSITKDPFIKGTAADQLGPMVLQKEVRTMAAIAASPYAIKPMDFVAWFDVEKATKANLSLIMESGGRDLKDFYLSVGENISLTDEKQIVSQVFTAIVDLHNRGYYHMDIKSENITIKAPSDKAHQYEIKLIDFGDLRTSIFYRIGDNEKNNLLPLEDDKEIGSSREIGGTPGYMSNCIDNKMYAGDIESPANTIQLEKKDSYALGMTLIATILAKNLKFPKWYTPDNRCAIIRGFRDFYDANIDTIDLKKKGLNGLVRIAYKMTRIKFEDRITVKEASTEWNAVKVQEAKQMLKTSDVSADTE